MGFYISDGEYYEGDRQSEADQEVTQRPSNLHIYQNGSWVLGAAPVPQSVEMRQARLALLNAGFLDTVNAAVAPLPRNAQIEWEFAQSVERSNQLVNAILPALGLSDAQIDQLFITAATL